MKKNVLLAASSLLLVVACTGKHNKSVQHTDLVTYDVKIDANTSSMSQEKQELVKKINAGEKVSFQKITELFILGHQKADFRNVVSQSSDEISKGDFEKTKKFPLYDYLLKLSNASKGKDFFSLKQSYESEIEKISGKEIQYNRDAKTMDDIRINNRQQCYSGTSLNLVIQRSHLHADEYRNENFVVIFTPGHQLPGKMIKTRNDGWRLFSVETTASGEAIQSRGGASEIDPSQMKIVDADLYILSEVFKRDLNAEAAKALRYKILEITAKKYGLTMAEEARVTPFSDVGGSLNGRGSSDDINSTLFSFGEDNTPAGDIKRAVVQNEWTADQVREDISVRNTPPQPVQTSSLGSTQMIQQHRYLGEISPKVCQTFKQINSRETCAINSNLILFAAEALDHLNTVQAVNHDKSAANLQSSLNSLGINNGSDVIKKCNQSKTVGEKIYSCHLIPRFILSYYVGSDEVYSYYQNKLYEVKDKCSSKSSFNEDTCVELLKKSAGSYEEYDNAFIQMLGYV